MTTRRAFIGVLGGAAAWPLAAGAQIAQPRIAFLGAESTSTNRHFLDAFRQGMREHGYVDGQNVTLLERWGEGRSERFPELIGELLALKADVIVAVSQSAARAAKNATSTVPIVFIASDPLGSGLVSSLARPAGNLTGFSLFLGDEFSSKWLELLKEAVPGISRVTVLWNPVNPANTLYVTVLRGAAEKLGIMLQAQAVSDPDRFTGAFATMVAQRAQALVVVIDPLTVRYRDLIVELAMNNRLPAMYGFREFADAGGLIAYGVNLPHLCRRAAVYVDKIIKGAKPADLPIEQPTRFELVINLKTARALGLEIPPILIARADEVIEWGRREALQHQQLSPLPMRRHPRRRARHDSEKRPTKLELVVNLRTGKGPRCRGAHRNSLARRRGNRVKYIMSVVGSAPRRRESSVEEDSTRRVVD